MATNTDLISILQTVNQILSDHQPSYKSIVNSIDQILSQYQITNSNDNKQYNQILINIDDILAQYSTNDNGYDKIVSDINDLITQYGDDKDQINNRETDSVDIPMNTDVSTLKKVTRLTDEQANSDINAEIEDPDKQGLIRQVPKAHLVYKRRMDNDTFEELWIYNVNHLTNDTKIRQAILAGTDISLASNQSSDGTKKCTIWSIGNAECVKLTGIPE